MAANNAFCYSNVLLYEISYFVININDDDALGIL